MREPGGVHERFRRAALAAPAATAVIGLDGRATSYEALLAAVDSAAGRLDDELVDGDVLGLAVADPCVFVTVYLAAARLGIITVLLDSRLSEAELQASAARYDASRLAVDDGAASPEAVGFTLRACGDPTERRRRAREGYAADDFVIHLTSGSTGVPKGIVMSQAAIAARIDLWGADLEVNPADVVLCALPLDHCHGIDVLTLPALCHGATVVFAGGARLTGRALARLVHTHGVTLVSGLPVMYQMLTAAAGVQPSALATLRTVISGSAPLPVATQEEFGRRFGIPLRQVYGLSEIGVITYDRHAAGAGTIGLPISGIEWRLEPVDETGAAGEPLRELFVRGPAMARGYYRDPAAEAEMFQDGWLRTRDLLVAEPDGWHVRGRHSTFINVAGSKVAPLEVEAALRACAGVVEAAVVGLPDAGSGEQVTALLVVDASGDLDAVRREVGERLLSHQVPQRYEVTDAVPRTPLGKIDYAAVRRRMERDEVMAP